jgi:hypothetical protein
MRLVLFALVLTACPPADDAGSPSKPGPDTGPDTAAPDADGDGVPDNADCDPADQNVYPGQHEIPYDGIDNDCDGEDVNDVDGDGYVGVNGGGDDCDDSNPEVNPGATEVCYNHIDDDCVGDDAESDDCDDDGYVQGEDCDDENPDAYPGATETWYDGVDSDCLADDDYDQDGDGEQRAEDGGTDCDDLDPEVNTEADEVWDGIDNDCDDSTDNFTDKTGYSRAGGDSGFGEDGFGGTLVTLGDLDGDGLTDYATGMGNASDGLGRVWVVPTAAGTVTPKAEGLAYIDGSDYLYLGWSIDTVDGVGLVAGGPGGGAAYVFPTSLFTGLAALSDADATATVTFDGAGYRVAGLGDLDGDGLGELLVSGGDGYGSAIGVFAGASLSGVPGLGDASWATDDVGGFINAAANVGDVDGDGWDELAVVAGAKEDALYLVTGATVAAGGTADLTAALTLDDPGSDALFMAVDDVDGDGLGEVGVSSAASDAAWLATGAALAVADSVPDAAFATVAGGTPRWGAGLGDLDEDGVLDVAVAMPGAEVVYYLGVDVVAAGGTLAPAAGTPSFSAASGTSSFGSLVVVTDAEGDGDADVLVSVGESPGSVAFFLNQ